MNYKVYILQGSIIHPFLFNVSIFTSIIFTEYLTEYMYLYMFLSRVNLTFNTDSYIYTNSINAKVTVYVCMFFMPLLLGRFG